MGESDVCGQGSAPTSEYQEFLERLQRLEARIDQRNEERSRRMQDQAEFEKRRRELHRELIEHRIEVLRAREQQLEQQCLRLRWKANEIPYLPEGVQPHRSVDGGVFNLLVDEGSASAMEMQRLTFVEIGRRPYFDLDHEDEVVAFFPEQFVWRGVPRPGVYAKGVWTEQGVRDVLQRKRYWSFSPCLEADTRYTPAVVASFPCLSDTLYANGNLGGFTSRPMLRGIRLHGL